MKPEPHNRRLNIMVMLNPSPTYPSSQLFTRYIHSTGSETDFLCPPYYSSAARPDRTSLQWGRKLSMAFYSSRRECVSTGVKV
ncbi:hypothetical protein SCLCIDRAFT_1220329, partial [Scleroderma citrinum Foug A]